MDEGTELLVSARAEIMSRSVKLKAMPFLLHRGFTASAKSRFSQEVILMSCMAVTRIGSWGRDARGQVGWYLSIAPGNK